MIISPSIFTFECKRIVPWSSGNRVNFSCLYGEDTGYRSPVTLPYRSKTFGLKSPLRNTLALKSPTFLV